MARNSTRLFSYPSLNSGSILIASIWVLTFFLILSVGLSAIVSSQVKLAGRIQQRVISQHLATGACVQASAKRKEDNKSYDCLYELRQNQKLELGNGQFCYILIDEESKVNINTASSEVIKALLEITSDLSEASAQELAEAIVDYRAEQTLRLKEEILNIEEVKKEIFDSFKDFITVYGKGDININTASAEVLRAIGLDEGLARTIVEFRQGPDQKEATPDDAYFETTGEIIDKLRLTGEPKRILLSMISNGLINVKSSNFCLQIETKVLGKPAMNYRIVLDDEGKIREWVEY